MPPRPAPFDCADADIDILTARLDVVPRRSQALAALLSADERERASRFAFERDRRRYVVARGRLRELLGERLGVAPQVLEFSYGAHGKPALAPRFADSGLCFNVSHSDDVAGYAFTRGREIGIDVETVRALADADDIAARFFSVAEREAYAALDPRDRPAGFFNCWTRKEAFIKALGDGLSYPLNRFDVTLVPGAPARLLRVADQSGEHCDWMLRSFVPGRGLAGAVVFRIRRTPQ